MKRTFTGILFCSPLIVGILGFAVMPILASFWFSACNGSSLDAPRFVGLVNYRELHR